MDNLQTEVLEIEFLTFSKGMTTISEEDFARILLRYTNVENISSYLENVRQAIPDEKVGGTFRTCRTSRIWYIQNPRTSRIWYIQNPGTSRIWYIH